MAQQLQHGCSSRGPRFKSQHQQQQQQLSVIPVPGI
ncbi:hypothetical protein LEMLEM_LOCUS9149 [Lemmus lemmus]